MTGQDILSTALAFVSEKIEGSDYKDYALPWLNLLLQECLATENSIRRAEEREVLAEAPYLSALTETVPYHDSITRTALPYGIVSYIYTNEDYDARAQDARNKYVNALNEAARLTAKPIVDVYGGDCYA